MKTITSTEANRSFSKLLARAAKGESTAITVRGKVIARLEPAASDDGKAAERRKLEHVRQLRRRPVMDLPRFSRDELYD